MGCSVRRQPTLAAPASFRPASRSTPASKIAAAPPSEQNTGPMGRLAAGSWVFVDHPDCLRMSEGKERSPTADRKHVAGYNAAAPDLSNNDPIRSMRNPARAFL